MTKLTRYEQAGGKAGNYFHTKVEQEAINKQRHAAAKQPGLFARLFGCGVGRASDGVAPVDGGRRQGSTASMTGPAGSTAAMISGQRKAASVSGAMMAAGATTVKQQQAEVEAKRHLSTTGAAIDGEAKKGKVKGYQVSPAPGEGAPAAAGAEDLRASAPSASSAAAVEQARPAAAPAVTETEVAPVQAFGSFGRSDSMGAAVAKATQEVDSEAGGRAAGAGLGAMLPGGLGEDDARASVGLAPPRRLTSVSGAGPVLGAAAAAAGNGGAPNATIGGLSELSLQPPKKAGSNDSVATEDAGEGTVGNGSPVAPRCMRASMPGDPSPALTNAAILGSLRRQSVGGVAPSTPMLCALGASSSMPRSTLGGAPAALQPSPSLRPSQPMPSLRAGLQPAGMQNCQSLRLPPPGLAHNGMSFGRNASTTAAVAALKLTDEPAAGRKLPQISVITPEEQAAALNRLASIQMLQKQRKEGVVAGEGGEPGAAAGRKASKDDVGAEGEAGSNGVVPLRMPPRSSGSDASEASGGSGGAKSQGSSKAGSGGAQGSGLTETALNSARGSIKASISTLGLKHGESGAEVEDLEDVDASEVMPPPPPLRSASFQPAQPTDAALPRTVALSETGGQGGGAADNATGVWLQQLQDPTGRPMTPEPIVPMPDLDREASLGSFAGLLVGGGGGGGAGPKAGVDSFKRLMSEIDPLEGM